MTEPWESDLADAAAELARLDETRLVTTARAAVADWKPVEPFSSFFLPLPIIAQDVPSLEGAWARAGGEHGGFNELLGVDANGRPVLHVLDGGSEFERANHVWFWDDDGSFVEVELMGSGPHVRRARVVDGQVVHVVTASAGDSTSVRLLTWRDGVAIRVQEASRWHDGRGSDCAVLARVRDGRVEQLWSGRREARGGMVEGLRRAAEIEPDRLVWDGRVQRPERWPGAAAARRLVEPLARAFEGALRAAAASCGIEEPFLLEVRQGDSGDADRHLFPPFARLAGTRWRDGMRAASAYDGAAMQHLWRGVESGEVVELRLVDHLDDEALRSCRVFSTAMRTGAPSDTSRAAASVASAVGDRLAVLLNTTPLAGAADPFLALVHIGDPYSEDGVALGRARAAVGEPHVERFLASVASAASAGDDSAADHAADKGALIERDELEALLAAMPLAAHATRLSHEVAAEALHLDPAPADGPLPGSRLGGPPLLPPGVTWPMSDDGGTLTFLAAIDLSELPRSEVTAALPATGWLLFFAGMYSEASEGLIDDTGNEPGSVARVLFAEQVVAAEPPDVLLAVDGGILRNRPVVARCVLTLPSDYEAAERLGLDVFEAEAYQEVVERLQSAVDPERRPAAEEPSRRYEARSCNDDGYDEDEVDGSDEDGLDVSEAAPIWDRADHWIGGHITGVQGHPPQDQTTLLLHLAWDEDLGFQFQDGGAVQFRIPTAALEARDWSRAFAEGDSC